MKKIAVILFIFGSFCSFGQADSTETIPIIELLGFSKERISIILLDSYNLNPIENLFEKNSFYVRYEGLVTSFYFDSTDICYKQELLLAANKSLEEQEDERNYFEKSFLNVQYLLRSPVHWISKPDSNKTQHHIFLKYYKQKNIFIYTEDITILPETIFELGNTEEELICKYNIPSDFNDDIYIHKIEGWGDVSFHLDENCTVEKVTCWLFEENEDFIMNYLQTNCRKDRDYEKTWFQFSTKGYINIYVSNWLGKDFTMIIFTKENW